MGAFVKRKRLAVLTSGGDAPGMNAAIRAVVRSAIAFDMQIFGVTHGYNGLIKGEFEEMQLRSVSDIIQNGGTVLYTARCPEFSKPEGIQTAVRECWKNNIDGVVCIGGDGTFRGARDLTNAGVPCIGIPGTIDNDIGCSEYTIGYDTAMNTAMRMVDNIRDTAQSHDRCNIVEVMGHRAGFLAMNTGIACGASVIIIPEIEYDFDRDIRDKMRNSFGTGKHHFIIVVAEGAGNIDEMKNRIENELGMDTRTTILGHIQRGGSPTVRDRVMATEMGHHAVELFNEDKGGRIVCVQNHVVTDMEINEALETKRPFDFKRYEIAHTVSV